MSNAKMKSGILFLICVLVAALALVSIPGQSFSEEVQPNARADEWTLFSQTNLSSVALNASVTENSVPGTTASNVVVADACLSLLQGAQRASQQATAHSVPPVAGQAAALSLIFGVRYALGPVETPGTAKTEQTPAVHTDGQRAAAIAQYRRCRNDQSLATL